MSDDYLPRVGGVLSADIAVPEHEREVRFYADVLGTGEEPLWRDDLMNRRGTPIIGLGPSSPEYGDLPLQWMPHIQVADVARSAARALERGANEAMHGRDDDGNSQWAVLVDPFGAAFGLIPVVAADQVPASETDPTAGPAGPAGTIAHIDLTVEDVAGARDFYGDVVGWAPRAQGGGFAMCGEDGERLASIHPAGGGRQGVPPVWMLHLPVGDLAESLRRAEAGGGRVLWTSQGADGSAAQAVIEDPVGVRLTLVRG